MGESEETTSKPFTGPNGQTFEGHDECVRTFEDEEGIDDPDAFCAWLEEEGKEALSDPEAEEVLTELTVEYVSAVDNPAQDSEWVIAKDAEGPDGKSHRWQSEVRLYVRKDDDFDTSDDENREKQIAFAPVLIPKEADKQGDVIPAPAIEDAAHKYLAEYRKVDSDHDLRAGKGTPVESWTLKQGTTFELPDGSESRTYSKGTWVMGIKFDDATWERVKAGELDGLSIYGGARPIDVDALLGDGVSHKANDTDGDVNRRAVLEATAKQEEDPCWEGYTMVGTKIDENGNEVPDCVPDEDVDEANLNGSAEQADDVHDKTMGTDEDDPGDTGQEKDESVEKMLDEDGISNMLMSIQEADGLTGQTTIEDFVLHAIEQGNVDESQITGMSVLLNGGSDGGDMEPEADGSDEDEMGMSGDDDESIDLDADKSDGDDATKSGDDVEKSVDVDKSDDDAVAKIADAVETLSKKVEAIEDKVDDRDRRSDKMDVDDLSDRIAKDMAGVDDPDVARKAIREQVEKSDGDDDLSSVGDYDGITEDEDATAEASSGDDADTGDGSLHSAAANSRMAGGN